MMADTNGWHIAKSVPATLLLGLITQAGAIVWTVSMMMADIQENQTDIVEFGQRISWPLYTSDAADDPLRTDHCVLRRI